MKTEEFARLLRGDHGIILKSGSIFSPDAFNFRQCNEFGYFICLVIV